MLSELEQLIQFFRYQSKIHICVHDISGILSFDSMRLNVCSKIHSTAYCDAAKSSRRGYELCVRCKARANRKAVEGGVPFYGICPYGMVEVVYPVFLDGAVACIIYIGHILPSEEEYLSRVRFACKLTGVSLQEMKEQAAFCENDCNVEHYMKMAEILSREIRRLWRAQGKAKSLRCNSVVSNVEEYLAYHYAQDITLKNVAELYFMNEKYLGRLFLRETGKTFRQYLNDVRLEHAVRLLEETRLSVLQISLECGYSNVTYFNRVFKTKFGSAPSAQRRAARGRFRER